MNISVFVEEYLKYVYNDYFKVIYKDVITSFVKCP